MNGLLLAAGLGTRFLPFTQKIPKPAIPLLNIPIALYNLHVIQQLGIDSLTVNTHHLPEKVKTIFTPDSKIGVPIHFSDEAGQILGTGGAIKQARSSLSGSGTFAVANADIVNGFAITDALENHHQEQPMSTMIVMKHPEAGKKYGAVWADEKGAVVHIGKAAPKGMRCEPFHFVGIHLLEESIFKYIPDGPCDINSEVYIKAIKAGEQVRVFEKSGLWFDAGTLKDFLDATDKLLEVLPKLQHQPYYLSLFRRFWPNFDRRPNLWEGEGCEHLLPLGTQNKTLLDRNCHVHSSVRVTGFCVLGEGVKIEKNVELHNTVVTPGVHIKAGAKYSNTLLI